MNRRRVAIVVAWAALAALLQAAAPGPVFGDHTPDRPGYLWVAGTFTSTPNPETWTHTNYWTCESAVGCRHDDIWPAIDDNENNKGVWVAQGGDGKSACEGLTARGGPGCGHESGNSGWRYVKDSHTDTPEPRTYTYTCTAGGATTASTQNGEAHCGRWVEECGEFASGPGTGPAEHRHASGSGTGWHAGCGTHVWDETVCPLWTAGHGHSSVPTNVGQHSHSTIGDGYHTGCQPSHTPDCITGLVNTQRRTWQPTHAAGTSGHTATSLLGCDPPPCDVTTATPAVSHRHASSTGGAHTDCQAHPRPQGDDCWHPGHGHSSVPSPCRPECPAGDQPTVSHQHSSSTGTRHMECRVHPKPACGDNPTTWRPGDGHANQTLTDLTPCCPSGDQPTVLHRHATGAGSGYHRGCDTHTKPACGDNPTIWRPGDGHAHQTLTDLTPCVTYECDPFSRGAGTTPHRHTSPSSGTGWHAGCATHRWDKTVCPSWTAGHGHSTLDNSSQPACRPCPGSPGSQHRHGTTCEANHIPGGDKVSLDVFWLRDESLEDTDDLPAPGVIAAKIVEDLEAALEELRTLAESLEGVGETGADGETEAEGDETGSAG